MLLTVQDQEVAAAKVEVARQRQAAAANLVRKQSLEVQAEAAEASVRSWSTSAPRREQPPSAPSRPTSPSCATCRPSRTASRGAQEARRRGPPPRAAAARAAGPPQQPASATAARCSGNGFLDYPVTGPITSPFGWRIHPIYGYRSLHDGIDIGAACGTPIKAAAAGKVISEYYQTAWGNRIIIDHGVHYGVGVATISNHLSGYAVTTGEHVKRGQVVGYVGTTGWSTGCHLHFTVMENGTPVDPMNWF